MQLFNREILWTKERMFSRITYTLQLGSWVFTFTRYA